jgi:hypothetical protein
MGVLLFEMFTGRVPFDDDDVARLVRHILTKEPPRAETLRPDLPRELLSILDRAIARDPESRFSDADALADTISAFEGNVLDRVLAEVSVTRSKMVKLMVILEANKSLAATFDPTETLRIILKTATSETDAERGTIFLKEPGSETIVSQILEGGAVAPIVLPLGRGIAGTVAKTGEIVNITKAYEDPRFDRATDVSSGFRTRTILAAPLRTPAGEIVGVVELLNKRTHAFTKDDEEFLAEVGTHSALAVEGVRQHEAAVERARREGAAAALRGVRPLLGPGAWPRVPGLEAAPLRWDSDEGIPVGSAAEADRDFLALLLVEASGAADEAFGPLARGLASGRSRLAGSPAAEVVDGVLAAAPSCAATAVRWSGGRLSISAARAPLPFLFREGRVVRISAASEGSRLTAECETAKGDLVILASSGLERLRAGTDQRPPTRFLNELARHAQGESLKEAFARTLADWKAAGVSPGPADVVLLAARRTS